MFSSMRNASCCVRRNVMSWRSPWTAMFTRSNYLYRWTIDTGVVCYSDSYRWTIDTGIVCYSDTEVKVLGSHVTFRVKLFTHVHVLACLCHWLVQFPACYMLWFKPAWAELWFMCARIPQAIILSVCEIITLLCLRPHRVEALSNAFVWHLYVTYIRPKSRTERLRKTKIGTEVAHITRDFGHHFQDQKVKGQLVADVLNSEHAGTGATWWINTKILLCRNSTATWRINAKILSTCRGRRHIV